MNKIISTGLVLTMMGAPLIAGSAMAGTMYVADTMKYFPGYSQTAHNTYDRWGIPEIIGMNVSWNDTTKLLTTVEVLFQHTVTWGSTTYTPGHVEYDSLFINTDYSGTLASWHEWDYFWRYDGTNDYWADKDGNIKTGLYAVKDNSPYTLVTASNGRYGHPEGIAPGTAQNPNLTLINAGGLAWTAGNPYDKWQYDFTGTGIKYTGNQFAIAYVPWCANDVIGTPVPEPATMFLLGCGLVGLSGMARLRMKKG